MKVARWHGQKDIRVEEIETPALLGRTQVKIAVKYAGICGSDLHEYLGGPIFIPTVSEHPYSKQKAPVTMGHEYCGEIVEVGENVTDLAVGDRVVVEPILSADGKLVGQYNLDPNLGFIGLAGDGGFAEFSVVEACNCHKLPDEIDFQQGALTEPAAVALYAVRQSKFRVGDSAVVFGAGPIGLLIIDALNAAGATDIYAVEVSPERQALAHDLGAIVIDPMAEDAVAKIQELTLGGAGISFEVTGVPKVLAQSLEVLKNDGECIVVSIWETEASFHPNELVIKEKSMKGIIAYRHIFPDVLKLMTQGYFSKDKLVTKVIKLDDIVNEGFEALVKEKAQIKILVSPE